MHAQSYSIDKDKLHAWLWLAPIIMQLTIIQKDIHSYSNNNYEDACN